MAAMMPVTVPTSAPSKTELTTISSRPGERRPIRTKSYDGRWWLNGWGAPSFERLQERAINRLDAVGGRPHCGLAETLSFGIVGPRRACACRKSNPDILMMQPAQDRKAKNITDDLNGTRYGRVLI